MSPKSCVCPSLSEDKLRGGGDALAIVVSQVRQGLFHLTQSVCLDGCLERAFLVSFLGGVNAAFPSIAGSEEVVPFLFDAQCLTP